MRRLAQWAASALLIGVAMAASARAESPVPGGTLHVGLAADMKTLDPVRSSDFTEREIMYLVFNSILRLDTDFSVRPELAESWDVAEDGRRVTFHLRQGIKFHDGTPFDASVVKWNIERRLDPAAKSPQRKGLSDIVTSVEVADPNTVVFNLKTPAPGLMGMLAQREGMMESPTAAAKYGEDFGSHPVGTGPFIFREWVRGNHVTVDRNPSYWEHDKPYLDHVVIHDISGSVVGIQRLLTGEIDIVNSLTPQDVKPLEGRAGIQVIQAPSNHWISLQWQVDKPPFNNAKLRQAIAYALDRKRIVDIVMLGKAPVAESPTPPGLWWYSPEVKSYPYDPEKAKALLKEAGYQNGLDLTIAAPTNSRDPKIDQLVQEQLKAIGINLTVQPVADSDFYALVVKRAINFTPEDWTQRPDPDGLFRALYYTNEWANSTGYTNPEVDSLLDKARSMTDPQQRKPLYTQMQQIVVRDLPYVPLFFQASYSALRDNVKGYVWIPDSIPRYRDVWKAASK